MHSYEIYDALCAHRRARGDKHKNGHFCACHHEALSTLQCMGRHTIPYLLRWELFKKLVHVTD